MTIRAALLDADGVFQRIDELDGVDALTGLHLPQITACDLPPGRYRWIADEANPFGGAFWAVDWLEKIERARERVETVAARADARRARLTRKRGGA